MDDINAGEKQKGELKTDTNTSETINAEDKAHETNVEEKLVDSENCFNNLELDKILDSLKDDSLQENEEKVNKPSEKIEEVIIQQNKQVLNSNDEVYNQNESNPILQKNEEKINLEINNNVFKTNYINSNQDTNYENLFQSSFSPSPVKKQRSSITIEDLTNGENNLKKSTTVQKDEFLKIEDWNFIDRIQELEKSFQSIKINRTDIYNLFGTIKKCDLYFKRNEDVQVAIGPISSLEHMVESTFFYDKKQLDQICEHIISLEQVLFRWRSVSGDGNCYYRAIYFFLERLVLEKNILYIKNILVEINEKFEENYTKFMDSSIRNDIQNINRTLIVKILYLIVEILDQNEPDATIKAYDNLVKSFLFCKTFDRGMVMYFRLKIFDFIKKNRNGFYSQDFPVKIGNLLPSQYETENGDFLYDLFFTEQLMKMDTEAEKIVIYLTPFVLKVNLKILIYEFDHDSSVIVKDFNCNLPDKPDINLLYRKTHYDIIYLKPFYQKYAGSLCHYVNLNESLKVVSAEFLNRMRNIKSGMNIESNLYAQEDYSNTLINIDFTSNNQTAVSNSNSLNSNANSSTTITNENNKSVLNLNENNYLTCLVCKETVLCKPNILNVCSNCINSELNNLTMANYLQFITECQNVYQHGNESSIPKIFNEIFNTKIIKFVDKPLTLTRMSQLAETNIKLIIKETKSKVCVVCLSNTSNIKNSNLMTFPCSCVICSKGCMKIYFSFVFSETNSEKNSTLCFCGYQFSKMDYKQIYETLEENKLKDYQKTIGKFVLANVSRVCIGGCMDDYRYADKEFYSVYVRDEEMSKTFKIKQFRHVVCDECMYPRKMKSGETIECIVCTRLHKIEKVKKAVDKGEDQCSIL